jgi:hypothetical protein
MRITVTLTPLNTYENNHMVVNTSDIEQEMRNRGHAPDALQCIQNPIQLDNRRPDKCKGVWIYEKKVKVKSPTVVITTDPKTTNKEESVAKKQAIRKSRIKKQKY